MLTTEKAKVVLLPDVHVFHRQASWFLELQLLVPLWEVPWVELPTLWHALDNLHMVPMHAKVCGAFSQGWLTILWVYLQHISVSNTYQCKVASSFLSRTSMLDFLFFFPISFHRLGWSCMLEYSTGWKSLRQVVLPQSCWWTLRDVECASLHG